MNAHDATDVVISIVHASGVEETIRCLDSLEADRTRNACAEVVVLDNAAVDGLAVAVRSLHPRVRVIDQSYRAGFGANQNAVIRRTKSRYVFVLNPDTRVPPGTVDTLVEFMDAHPEVAIAGPAIRGFDGRPQGSAWRLMTIPVQLVWALTLGTFGAVVSRGSRPRRVGAVSASAMIARRRALDCVGAFDESYFMFGEEADLARRLRRAGYDEWYVPAAHVFHRGQHSTRGVSERRVNETWRSLDIYLARFHSPLEARVIRGVTGAGYAIAFGVACVARRLPSRARPARAHAWTPDIYRLHVRNAFRGVRSPGLRDLAERWNASRT